MIAPKPLPAGRTPARTAALTDEQKPIYALGLLLQRSLDQFDLTAAELDIVDVTGTHEEFAGDPALRA